MEAAAAREVGARGAAADRRREDGAAETINARGHAEATARTDIALVGTRWWRAEECENGEYAARDRRWPDWPRHERAAASIWRTAEHRHRSAASAPPAGEVESALVRDRPPAAGGGVGGAAAAAREPSRTTVAARATPTAASPSGRLRRSPLDCASFMSAATAESTSYRRALVLNDSAQTWDGARIGDERALEREKLVRNVGGVVFDTDDTVG